MKKKSVLKVVLATILVVALCTWIFPSASFSTSLVEGERAQIGLFDLFSYPMVALTYFGYVVVYTLAVGMFYGVANKIPAYHALIEKLQKLYVGKEWLFLSIVIVLISAIVSVSGLSFGMIFVFPFIISVILKMGYNKLVAASVTVGSVIAGMAGTTLGSGTVSYMNQLLGTDMFNEMVSKIVILVAFIIILIANILMYAKKTKNNTLEVNVSTKKEESKKEVKDSKVSNKEEVKEDKKETSKKKASAKTSKKETKSTSKKKTTSKKTTKTKAAMAKNDSEVIKVKEKKEKKVRVWPFVVLFDLMIILLAISVFDWSGLFEISLFKDVTTSVTEFEVLGFSIFGKILGVVNEFGLWSLNVELPVFIMLATLFLALIYRVKWSDLCDGIEDGVKKAVKPSIVMLLAYVVLIIVTYHPFQLVITKFLLDLTSGLNVVTMAVAAMVSSIFNVDPIYVAQSTIPYVMSVITDSSLYPLIGVIFQAIYGLMMLVAPTSIILVGTLSYLDIPYGQWLKHIWKIFVELLVVLLVIFLIILAI